MHTLANYVHVSVRVTGMCILIYQVNCELIFKIIYRRHVNKIWRPTWGYQITNIHFHRVVQTQRSGGIGTHFFFKR